MFKKDILDILACPKCKGTLKLSGDEKYFICEKENLRYPIEDGIPGLLIEKAEPIKKSQ